MFASCESVPCHCTSAAPCSLCALQRRSCEAVSRCLRLLNTSLYLPLQHVSLTARAGDSCAPLDTGHTEMPEHAQHGETVANMADHCAGPTEGKRPVARGAHGEFVDGGYMYIFGGICVDEVQAPTCAPAPGKLPATCSCHAPSGRVQLLNASASPQALSFRLHGEQLLLAAACVGGLAVGRHGGSLHAVASSPYRCS